MPDGGGILTGPEIRKALFAGDIVIDPINEEHLQEGTFVNPASYDLTLGNKVVVYAATVGVIIGYNDSAGVRRVQTIVNGHPLGLTPSVVREIEQRRGKGLVPDNQQCIDSKVMQKTWEFTIDPELGWILWPGIGYLMHTVERVTTNKYIPVLDGKSSIGRLFVTAHVTAGYGDPGFDGQYTLEVVATHPVIVYPGMRFCQMRFHTTVGEVLSYGHSGHYTGQASMGPVPSMTWKQFQDMEDYK